jgi:hypothetical protein
MAAEREAWAIYFTGGYDFFDELPEIGVLTDEYKRPDRAAGESAWHQFGAWFLAEYTPRHPDPWALLEFGEPHAR